MAQSPWGRSHNELSPDQQKQIDNQRKLDHLDNSLDTVSIWGNSHVNALLFKSMNDCPNISIYEHLLASFSLRSVHYLCRDTVADLMEPSCDIPQALSDLSASIQPNREIDTPDNIIKGIKNTSDEFWNGTAISPDRFIGDLYALCLQHCAKCIEGGQQWGYLHPMTLLGLADEATNTSSFDPLEPESTDHFIFDGYRSLSRHLQTQLDSLQTSVKNTTIDPHKVTDTPEALEQFTTAVEDMRSYATLLTALSDDLTDMIAHHAWPSMYEKVAMATITDINQDDALAELPPPIIQANDGIGMFLQDFIDANHDMKIYPEDVRILHGVLSQVVASHPSYTTEYFRLDKLR